MEGANPYPSLIQVVVQAMREELAVRLMSSIGAGRLTLLLGAGLSIPDPSSVPSAKRVAQQCAELHYRKTGEDLRDLDPVDPLGTLASEFYARNALTTIFIPQLVDWTPFRRPNPNDGHLAVADLICASLVDWVATTNFDTLVETGAQALGEVNCVPATTAAEAQRPQSLKPYVKLHGCCLRQPSNTLWCTEQLETPPWSHTVADFRDWLRVQMTERDLVLVGFWSDWAYLNQALTSCLTQANPRTIIVVDPAEPDLLKAKAPELWSWVQSSDVHFVHEQLSGDQFLLALTVRIGRNFVRQVFNSAGDGVPTELDFESLGLHDLDRAALYDLRRDLTGRSRGQPVRESEPDPSYDGIAHFINALVTRGGVFDGAEIVLNGQRIRVIKGAGRMISRMRDEFQTEGFVHPTPDLVVCVGSTDDGGVPADIARGDFTEPTVVRSGTSGQWMTQLEAEKHLGLVGTHGPD